MSTYEVRSISMSIERDWREAYAFASVPENFPRWASGLASGLERAGEEWIGQTPDGPDPHPLLAAQRFRRARPWS